MHITTKIWQKERSCIKITRRKRKRIDQLIKVMGNVHNYAPSAMKNRINAGVFSLLFRLIKTSLPKSRLLSCFPFLLKKLRFLHDIHLPKFMTAIQTLQIYTHTQWRKRKRKTSNPEQEDKVVAAALVVGEWVSERTRKKRKEKEEVEVWQHSSMTLGGFMWGAGSGTLSRHTNVRTHKAEKKPRVRKTDR